jgi:hypothetical protein
MLNKEYVTYRRTEITLYQDNAGFWGWVIGKETMIATFAYADSAFSSAKRHIDSRK